MVFMAKIEEQKIHYFQAGNFWYFNTMIGNRKMNIWGNGFNALYACNFCWMIIFRFNLSLSQNWLLKQPILALPWITFNLQHAAHLAMVVPMQFDLCMCGQLSNIFICLSLITNGFGVSQCRFSNRIK